MGALMRIFTSYLLFTSYVSLHGLVSAYPTGAGQEACITLSPLHTGTSEQQIVSPYRISVQSNNYFPNSLVVLTLSQNPDAPFADSFRGILLQARPDGSDIAVGSWLIDANSANYRYLTGCPDPSSAFGSLTHNSRSDKLLAEPVEFDWIAPPVNVGNIRFYATVVQNFATYWVELTSPDVLSFGLGSGVTFEDCPTTVNAFIPLGITQTTVTWTVPLAVDVSGNTVELQSTNNPGDTFQLGRTPVTYSYMDGNGDTFMCMFFVEVIDHVTKPRLEKVLSGFLRMSQKEMIRHSGVNIQSQEAYELASRNLLQPSGDTRCLVLDLRCSKFEPPDFEIEVHCVRESAQYLRKMINDTGLFLKTNAVAIKVRKIQEGPFSLNDCLLRKDWRLNPILDALRTCSPLMSTYKLLPLELQKDTLLSQKLVDDNIFDIISKEDDR